jgi:hypothetical protein
MWPAGIYAEAHAGSVFKGHIYDQAHGIYDQAHGRGLKFTIKPMACEVDLR